MILNTNCVLETTENFAYVIVFLLSYRPVIQWKMRLNYDHSISRYFRLQIGINGLGTHWKS